MFSGMETPEEAEARRFAEIAARAERKAALKMSTPMESNSLEVEQKPQFLSKKEREELALKKLEEKRNQSLTKDQEAHIAYNRFVTGQNEKERLELVRQEREREDREKERKKKEESMDSREFEKELEVIRSHYLGGPAKKRRILKPSEKYSNLFKMDWDADEDTSKDDVNPLYSNRVKLNPLFGRGLIGGIDPREQRKNSTFMDALVQKRSNELGVRDGNRKSNSSDFRVRIENTRMLEKNKEEEFSNAHHWSKKSLGEMTDRDWRIFREDFGIRIQGGKAPLPIRFWHESSIPEVLLTAIEKLNYKEPSPIQRQAIPVALSGKDIIGIAQTGSGKTAAFVIPMICYLLKLPTHFHERCGTDGPLALVMAPTRELAQQIHAEAVKLSFGSIFRVHSVVGGQDIDDQGFHLRRGVHILIGTPGRLLDCFNHNILVLNQCNYVVLDEADRMVDMGFENDLRAILGGMGGLLKPEDIEHGENRSETEVYRITSMYSATMPSQVEKIAKDYMRYPVIVRVGDEDISKNSRIRQIVNYVSEGQKKNILLDELKKLNDDKSKKVIVFVNSKKMCDYLGKQLELAHYNVGILHGGRSQDQREDTLLKFRDGEYTILVASDVAARGLDVPDVALVVNYDCPNKIESYCHRIGRTGRAGRSGVAITFLTDSDTDIMYELRKYLEATETEVPSQLARNPASQAPLGSRDDKGHLIGVKRDSVQYK